MSVCVWKKLCTSLHPPRAWAIQILWAVPVPSFLVKSRQKMLVHLQEISSRRECFVFIPWCHPLVSSWLHVWDPWNIILTTESHFRMIYCTKAISTSRGIYSGSHFLSGPMCAAIPHVPLLNTQGDEYVGVNMYYLFVKLRVRSGTDDLQCFPHFLCREGRGII